MDQISTTASESLELFLLPWHFVCYVVGFVPAFASFIIVCTVKNRCLSKDVQSLTLLRKVFEWLRKNFWGPILEFAFSTECWHFWIKNSSVVKTHAFLNMFSTVGCKNTISFLLIRVIVIDHIQITIFSRQF